MDSLEFALQTFIKSALYAGAILEFICGILWGVSFITVRKSYYVLTSIFYFLNFQSSYYLSRDSLTWFSNFLTFSLLFPISFFCLFSQSGDVLNYLHSCFQNAISFLSYLIILIKNFKVSPPFFLPPLSSFLLLFPVLYSIVNNSSFSNHWLSLHFTVRF